MRTNAAIESLESRKLLAVTAEFVGTFPYVLEVRGDGESNDITFTTNDNGANWTITGDGEDLGPFANTGFIIDLKSFGGNDTITADPVKGIGHQGIFVGGKGNDKFLDFGSTTLVVIYCGSGKDRVNGAFGSLLGGPGDDTLSGEGHGDEVVGGPGDDLLLGGGGQDNIAGNKGNDTLRGGADNDDMLGGPGDDLIKGQGGHDAMYGEGGKDTLNGGADNDEGFGGLGADKLIFNDIDLTPFVQDPILPGEDNNTNQLYNSIELFIEQNLDAIDFQNVIH